MKIVKAGYGTLAEVREMDARTVLQILNYETFSVDYQDAWVELNK